MLAQPLELVQTTGDDSPASKSSFLIRGLAERQLCAFGEALISDCTASDPGMKVGAIKGGLKQHKHYQK